MNVPNATSLSLGDGYVTSTSGKKRSIAAEGTESGSSGPPHVAFSGTALCRSVALPDGMTRGPQSSTTTEAHACSPLTSEAQVAKGRVPGVLNCETFKVREGIIQRAELFSRCPTDEETKEHSGPFKISVHLACSCHTWCPPSPSRITHTC